MAEQTFSDIKAAPQMPVVIKEDNQGTIALAKNPISHNRTKHIARYQISLRA